MPGHVLNLDVLVILASKCEYSNFEHRIYRMFQIPSLNVKVLGAI